MQTKRILQITFGNIYERTDGYKVRGYLINKLFSEKVQVDTFQIVEKKSQNMDNYVVSRGIFSKVLGLLFLPFIIIKDIKKSDIVLIEGSMFIFFAIISKVLRKRVIFDPQGSIAALGKKEPKGFYNTFARLGIGNVLDFVMSHISDLSLFVSAEDMDYFIRNYKMDTKRAKLVRLVIESPEPCHGITKNGNQVVFIGHLKAVQNKSAVDYLTKHIAPKMNGYKFIIIGAGKGNFKEYPDNVYFTGFVQEPKDLLCSSSLAVVPIISGTGVKTKILYFLALGIPTITTRNGAEGLINLNDIINKGLFISDLERFPQTIEKTYKLLDQLDPNYLRKYIIDNHSIDAMRRDIENILPEIIG